MSQYERLVIAQVRELMNRKMEPINIAQSMAMPLDRILVLMRLVNS